MRLLTIDQLAELLQVAKGYIYRLNYEGKIPGRIKLGHRTIRYQEEIIQKWLAERCPPIRQDPPEAPHLESRG